MGKPGMKPDAWKPVEYEKESPPVWLAVAILIAFCSLPIACAIYG